jgi:hypothetical protein
VSSSFGVVDHSLVFVSLVLPPSKAAPPATCCSMAPRTTGVPAEVLFVLVGVVLLIVPPKVCKPSESENLAFFVDAFELLLINENVANLFFITACPACTGMAAGIVGRATRRFVLRWDCGQDFGWRKSRAMKLEGVWKTITGIDLQRSLSWKGGLAHQPRRGTSHRHSVASDTGLINVRDVLEIAYQIIPSERLSSLWGKHTVMRDIVVSSWISARIDNFMAERTA